MADFSIDDIERSLKRWAAAVTGQLDEGGREWRIGTQETQIADKDRPYLLIDATDEAAPDFIRGSIPQGDIQMRQPFALTAYPSTQGTAAETKRRAREVADLLMRAITIGLVAEDDAGLLVTWPLALPVFDYATVPIRGSGAERAGPAEPYAQAEVDSPAARAIPDALDEHRWTVPLTFRLTWWQPGRVRPNAPPLPLVDGMPIEWTGP